MSKRLTLQTAAGSSIEICPETLFGIYPHSLGSVIAVLTGDDLAEHEVQESACEVSKRWFETRVAAFSPCA